VSFLSSVDREIETRNVNRMNWKSVLVLIGVAALAGCEKGEKVTPVTVTGKEYVVQALEGLLKLGQPGSEIGMVVEELNKYKKANPSEAALCDELIADTEGLMSGGSPEEFKAKVQAMLDKLNGKPAGGAATPPEKTE